MNYSLSFFFYLYRLKGISLIVDLCEIIYLTIKDRETSIASVSRDSDYIGSLNVMALSAEGINWPTISLVT